MHATLSHNLTPGPRACLEFEIITVASVLHGSIYSYLLGIVGC